MLSALSRLSESIVATKNKIKSFLNSFINRNKNNKVSSTIIKTELKRNLSNNPTQEDNSIFNNLNEEQIKENFSDFSAFENLDSQGNEKFENLLIIDDNFGIVTILENSLKNKIKDVAKKTQKEIKILKLSTSEAPLKLIVTLSKNPKIKINYAILDFTFGLIVRLKNENVKITGVDVFSFLIEKNPNLKFIFFTGNNFNSNHTEIKKAREIFKKIAKKEIDDFLLYKGQISYNRDNLIIDKLFNLNNSDNLNYPKQENSEVKNEEKI